MGIINIDICHIRTEHGEIFLNIFIFKIINPLHPNINNIEIKKKTTIFQNKRVAFFFLIFVNNLFYIWHNRRQLDSQLCFCIQSVDTSCHAASRKFYFL